MKKTLEALKAAIPLLDRLGDFIGNGEKVVIHKESGGYVSPDRLALRDGEKVVYLDRCKAMADILDTIHAIEKTTSEPVLSLDAVAQKVTAILGGLDEAIDSDNVHFEMLAAIRDSARELAGMIRKEREIFVRTGGNARVWLTRIEPWCALCRCLPPGRDNHRVFDSNLGAIRCSDTKLCEERAAHLKRVSS